MRRRPWFNWHSWAGITAGLMLFVICWSGTIAVVSHEIDWLLNPTIRANTVVADEIPFEQVAAAVERVYPDDEITEINAPRYKGFAMEVLATATDDVPKRIYVDPVTFEILGDTSYFNVQRFFRSFHMSLFEADYFSVLGIPVGYFVVLLLVIPLLIALITPLVFYRRWWRGFFKLETRKGRRIFWSDAHKLTGVWSLWFVAVIGLTSLWYFAEWFIPFPEEPIAPLLPELTATQPLSNLIAVASSELPSLEVTTIGLYQANEHVIYVMGHDDTVLTRDNAYVALDMRTAQVLEVYHMGRSGWVARLMETVDVLHFGTFSQLWSQLLYFLFGLLLSGLCLSGAYLQVQRQKNKQYAVRGPIIVAYLLTILILIMASSAGWSEIKAYGSHGAWPSVYWPVTFFIALWVCSTLVALSLWLKKLR